MSHLISLVAATPGPVIDMAVILGQLALIVVVARLCGIAVSKIGIPPVVGEIAAGVLLGPSLLGMELSGEEGHAALVESFGKVRRGADGLPYIVPPGLHTKKPWEKVHEFSIMEKILLDTMFDLPNTANEDKVVVDESTIDENKPPLLVYREAAKKA